MNISNLVLNSIAVKYNDDRIVNNYPTPMKFIPRPEWKIDKDIPLEIKLDVELKLKITLLDGEYKYKLIDATTKDENSYLVYFSVRLRGLYNETEETEETYKHLNYEIESVSMFNTGSGSNIIDRHGHVVAWLMSDAVSFEFVPEKCQEISNLPISTKREVPSRKGRQIFQIRRSEVSDIPETLNYGELAYSFKSKTLYIGDENEKPIAIVKNS